MAHKFLADFGELGLRGNGALSLGLLSALFGGISEKAWADSITPLCLMLHEIYDIYYCFEHPVKFHEKMSAKKEGRKIAGDKPSFIVDIRLSMDYTDVNGWKQSVSARGILDSVRFLIISLTAENSEFIKQCGNCGKYFITSGDKVKYCSPACRNRANVKRSYEKRKLEDRGGDY